MKRAAVILLSLTLFAAGTTASATTDTGGGGTDSGKPTDPRTERERVRKEKAAAAARLDALQADATDIDQALDDLADNVTYQERALDDASAAQEEASRQVDEAQRQVDEMAATIARLDAAVKQAALDAFVSAGSSGDLFSALLTGDLGDALEQDVLYKLTAGDMVAALDELAAAHAELKAAKRRADAAARKADEHRQKVEQRLADLQTAIDQQQELSTKIDDRIDETMAESANLADLDAKLSKEIAAREAALAAKARAKLEATRKRVAESVAASRVKTAEVSDTGKVTVPIQPTATPNLVRINGIVVAESIGPAVAQLVAWAAADGINLTGGGYRRPEDQIAVRQANCGSTAYDIWQKPSSQCHPPAARPGKSLHEKGLAVDFACNGELIANYSHWCYRWIASHAPKVGLKNRGVEAWHWSPNGN